MKTLRAVPLLILLAACSAGDASNAGLPYRTVIDTIGDTVVARTTGDVPDARLKHLALEWRAASDADDSAKSIGDISGMAVAPDGRVYVWDHATPALWMLDANGKSLTRIGRQGAGPGEYALGNGVAVRRDGSAVLWDQGNTRLNVYDAGGTFRTSVVLPFSYCCPGNAITFDSQDRTWLRAQAGEFFDKTSNKPGEHVVPAYFRFDASGKLIDTVLTPNLPGDALPVSATSQTQGGINMASRVVAYTTRTMYTVSPLGYVVFGQGRPYAVRAAVNGKPLRIEREFTPVPVSEDERAQIRANLEFYMRRMQPNWVWNGAEVPAEKPAFVGLTVGQDGRIWVQVSVPSEQFEPDPPPPTQTNPAPPVKYRGKEKRWDVFEPDGRYVGRVVAPRLFGAYVMRGNYVWGVLRDEDDVPAVVKMRIDPGM